jgi:thiamine-monophosphate kinase
VTPPRPPAPSALGPGREFDRIRRIAVALGARAQGLGDDCAVLLPGEGQLVASTDVSVEGVHFRRDWLSLEEIGWRAAAAALSDLAADGATPAGLLAAVTVPKTASDEDLTTLMVGVGGAAAESGAVVVGGDLSSGPTWSVGITVLGWSTAPVTRTGARPGDLLWVTGTLGGPRAALEAWFRAEEPSSEARRAFVRPVPRIHAGRWLARHGAVAMIDLSDGLGADTGHLAAASGVGLELELDDLPVAPSAVDAAARLGISPQQFAAESGEEYELLVALPPSFADEDRRAFESVCSLTLTRVGRAVADGGVRARLGGRPLTLAGFDHFA